MTEQTTYETLSATLRSYARLVASGHADTDLSETERNDVARTLMLITDAGYTTRYQAAEDAGNYMARTDMSIVAAQRVYDIISNV